MQHLAVETGARPGGSQGNRAERYYCHQRSDTIDWVSVAQLSDIARFAAQIVERLQQYEPAWARVAADRTDTKVRPADSAPDNE